MNYDEKLYYTTWNQLKEMKERNVKIIITLIWVWIPDWLSAYYDVRSYTKLHELNKKEKLNMTPVIIKLNILIHLAIIIATM